MQKIELSSKELEFLQGLIEHDITEVYDDPVFQLNLGGKKSADKNRQTVREYMARLSSVCAKFGVDLIGTIQAGTTVYEQQRMETLLETGE